ncbi:hypothetical protein [Vagococcus hydrophili]|uniref:Uncharacterized protein n=1 Tax=Vagococcus hydrophili TaxID=2714947 RepID=A0A6G8ARF1_9ENTE|nr:hypothetical protein [Vagococcus hydrophili]QIL47549.1 hypothetical protein G7082_02860 [Vagococcus hydrophili]
MLNLQTINEIKEIEKRKATFLNECRKEENELLIKIDKLSKEHESSILSVLKPKKLFSKQRTTESIEEELTQLRMKLKLIKEKELLLEKSSIKKEISLDPVLIEMKKYKSEKENMLKKIKEEAEYFYNQYIGKAEEYSQSIQQINQEITSSNNYLEKIFNDDVTYRDGSYWNNLGERVNRDRVGIRTISENIKLSKKDGI